MHRLARIASRGLRLRQADAEDVAAPACRRARGMSLVRASADGPSVRPLRSRISRTRLRRRGSQYRHGSFGRSQTGRRPVSDRQDGWRDQQHARPVSSAWRVRARQSRRKPCWYCEPDDRRDAVSGAPDVAAVATPAVAHAEWLDAPVGRRPACEAASAPHLPCAPAAPVGRSTDTAPSGAHRRAAGRVSDRPHGRRDQQHA